MNRYDICIVSEEPDIPTCVEFINNFRLYLFMERKKFLRFTYNCFFFF